MQNFCPQPWIGLDITPQGEFKPCCKFIDVISNNIEDYKKSDKLNELKNYHLNNKRHPGCKRCWDDEDANLLSKRQLDNKYVLNDKIFNINSDKINLLGLTFGNTCNLACRTCNTTASSRWLKEIKSHGNFNNQIIYGHNKFYKNKTFFKHLLEILDSNIHIDLAGGEPLLSGMEEHYEFINLILPNANNITLHYTTNCTNFPTLDLLNLWTRFKKVDIQFSIDGIGKKLEYIRWPAKWKTVYKNIQLYKDFASKNSNIQISISHTLSIFNVESINEFLDWCNKEFLPEPYIGMVNKPYEYNIKSLPNNLKSIISKKISHNEINQYMNSEDLSYNFPKTLEYIKFLDKVRQQNFKDIFIDSVIL